MEGRGIIVAGLLGLVVLAGCVTPDPSGDPVVVPRGGPAPFTGSADAPEATMLRDSTGPLVVTASVQQVHHGYFLNATATHAGTEPLGYEDGCGHDWLAVVVDADDTTHAVTPAPCPDFVVAMLHPGDVETFDAPWGGDGLPPGNATFQATFITVAGNWTAAAMFTVGASEG